MTRGPFIAAFALVCAGTLAVAGCGSSSNTSTSSGTTEGGTATVLMGTAPDFLDPQEGYTTQAAEADWITYTPLLTYRHASGKTGTELIPGLAASLPKVSSDGKTYTLTLRKGLKFSNGRAVKASDFTYTIERAIKLNWGGKSFFTNYIAGASAYDTGSSSTISGIRTNDSSGQIVIHLTSPYGAFANVLAFPAAGLVPTGTAMKNLSNNPPPGVGPYEITAVSPNRTFSLVKNPSFAALHIPNIPAGHLDKIKVNITSNTQSEAEQVLKNQADAFDPGDTLPPSLVPQIDQTASNRFSREPIPSTFYFFLNTQSKPFNNPLAREAVNLAVDRRALARLASGFLQPGCFFLPAGIVGHPTGSCRRSGRPDGNARDGLGRDAQPPPAVRRVLHERAERDRVQGDAEDRQRQRLLPDDRQRQDGRADGLRRLDPGLPEPVGLLSAARCQEHPADEQ
jgi:peptide/nickel transport system substrate-binding protein